MPDEPCEITNRLGPDRHVVSYFIGRDQRLLNLVCIVLDPSWDVESWTEPGDVGALRSEFVDWSPRLNGILDHIVEPVYRWALHDREPMPAWTVGRTTLLGDSCHPMVPFMAQGACMAIEDAAVLDRCLTSIDDPAAALASYERTRHPRASHLQSRSFDNCTTFHLHDGPEQQARDEFYESLRDVPDRLAAFDNLFGYDALTVPLA